MLEKILEKAQLTQADLIFLLGLTDPEDLALLYQKAYQIKEQMIGRKAYYRGLIEFSNRCIKDCLYCGIRSSNGQVERFDMTQSEILRMAQWAYDNEYGSIVLQSGERQDAEFIDFVTNTLNEIKKIGDGKLGVTLCLGEQSRETYEKWFAAGGHRYLLRIETTNPGLYQKIHPSSGGHSFETRVNCLKTLRELGYQVGTGVMIGLPGQTIEDLANDILFYEAMDIDMIGMGPYIYHGDTPLGREVAEQNLNSEEEKARRFELGLKMIAVTRLYLKDVNIAATTALQALNPLGREMGLRAGANILMPIITIEEHRAKYQLYENKPCIDDNADKCKLCLTGRVRSVGDEVGFGEWGDSPHYQKKEG